MRRGNLVNRQDLEAKQEIKNYKDTVTNQNIAMNRLSESIYAVDDRFEKKCNFLGSKIESIERSIASLELSDCKFREDINRSIGELKDILNKFGIGLNDVELCVNEDGIAIEEIESKLEFLADRQHKFIEKNRALSESTNHSLAQLRLFLIERMDSIKSEILSKPSGLDELKKDLNEELEIYKVDFNGLLREIQVSKKSVYVLQKNIENIYNKLERLK